MYGKVLSVYEIGSMVCVFEEVLLCVESARVGVKLNIVSKRLKIFKMNVTACMLKKFNLQ